MKLRDSNRIVTWIDDEKSDGVPVERPAQNGAYNGTCKVRFIGPPRVEYKAPGGLFNEQAKECDKCKKVKNRRSFPSHEWRMKERSWCELCRAEFPLELKARNKLSWAEGTKAYRQRQRMVAERKAAREKAKAP